MKSASYSFKKSSGRISVSLASGLTIAALLLQFFVPFASQAADTGLLAPNQTITNHDVDHPDYGWKIDNSRAIFNDSDDYAVYGLPDFGILAGSTINGIEVTVEGQRNGGRNLTAALWNVSNSNPDAYTSVKTASLSGSDTTQTLGGATDKWGKTWVVSDFADATFKIRVGATSGGDDALLDQVQVKVYFTPPISNPPLGQSCGLDIALVLDNSGSIDAGELAQMKTAFTGFVTTLSVTPSDFSVTKFNTTASVVQAFSSNETTINNAINNVNTSSGYTNWQDGLIKAQGTFDPRGLVPNLIVFASDGNPNRYGNPAQGTGSGSDPVALDQAITQANAIKTGGTRIITLGIGNATGQDALNPDNLKAISSADAYYDAADFGTLATTLQTLATDLCGGTITAHKIIDQDGNLATTGDQDPGSGWTFDVAGSPQTTDQNGDTQSVDVGQDNYSVTETPQTGYSLIGASCSIDQTPVGTPDLQNYQVTNIQVGSQDIVSCTFYNSPNAGNLIVYKHVVGAASASDFTISVSNGNPGSFPGEEQGTQVSIPAFANYEVTETPIQGYEVSFEGDCSGTMPAGGTEYCTVTNTELEPETGSLTVRKSVIGDNGGTAEPSDFTLTVTDSEQNVTAVQSGASNDFAPGNYIVGESGGPSGYSAAFSGDCDENGNIEIVAGESYTCIITNNDQPGILIVKKVIDGGTLSASSFSFSVNDGDLIPFESDGQNDLVVNAGVYTIAEQGVENYTASYVNCSEVQIGIGQTATCTITNTFVPPPVEPTTDVELGKSVEPSSVQSGSQATFTLNVTNNGPADASNVIVTDALPSGLTYSSHTASVGTTYDNTVDTWTIGSLANGAVATLTITVTVSGSDGQQIENNASLTIDPNIDINSENNSASATVTVTVPGQGGGPTPVPQPVVDGGGGGNGPIAQSNAYQDYLQQQAAAAPQAPAPVPEVKGETTQELPGTGFDMNEAVELAMLFLTLVGFAIVARKKLLINDPAY